MVWWWKWLANSCVCVCACVCVWVDGGEGWRPEVLHEGDVSASVLVKQASDCLATWSCLQREAFVDALEHRSGMAALWELAQRLDGLDLT